MEHMRLLSFSDDVCDKINDSINLLNMYIKLTCIIYSLIQHWEYTVSG